ncbi:rhodanese [Luteolibacter ambystomatis]|uniref:Rhodanese n=1 Tax=Luteolibacter ambystomatis TaxID=2824561 RepID=A0A975G716_9BACT|nr:rhodanese-like domain-containing protein [Luteolibacter ambystomatis]QUE49946.1 rhodanese [Luteolibacter ambystomatis]
MSLLPDPAATLEVTCAEVSGWSTLPESERPWLVDCREPEEWGICRIEGADLVPLGSFPEKIDALRQGASNGVVVYCHHGMRSLRATSFLRANGVESVFSMAGGIDAWSRTIDSEVPRY